MPCYYPMRGWRSKTRTVNGKRAIVFDRNNGFVDQEVQVSCGKCIGCKLEYSRQWAMRCMHEARYHEWNSFVTLTYDDAHLPINGTLVKKHPQDFFKRLRYHLGEQRIKYFLAGEYGEQLGRPHYHACIFGYFPKDVKRYSEKNGYFLYTSESLDRIWGKGTTKVGSVTYESAGYVARYCLKKITGEKKEKINELTGLKYYEIITDDGEIVELEPEYATMSLNPAIGKEWIEEYKDETGRDDSVVVAGNARLPPRYYESRICESVMQENKAKRAKRAKENGNESTLARLRVRETVKKAQIKTLRRS